MWLGGQQKRPAEQGEGQVGIVTMSEGGTAVLLDCERRGLQIYGPGGYTWTPRVNERVLVIQGKGEIPCVVGALQGGGTPDSVGIQARELTMAGDRTTVQAGGDAVVQAENVRLKGQVYVNGETLEELITRIVIAILAGMG